MDTFNLLPVDDAAVAHAASVAPVTRTSTPAQDPPGTLRLPAAQLEALRTMLRRAGADALALPYAMAPEPIPAGQSDPVRLFTDPLAAVIVRMDPAGQLSDEAVAMISFHALSAIVREQQAVQQVYLDAARVDHSERSLYRADAANTILRVIGEPLTLPFARVVGRIQRRVEELRAVPAPAA